MQGPHWLQVVFSVFIMPRGWIHLLYAGQSTGRLKLKSGMRWPGGSWMLSKALPDDAVRKLTTVLLVLAGGAFVVGGIGLVPSPGLGARWVALGAAALSALLFAVLWDGNRKNLVAPSI